MIRGVVGEGSAKFDGVELPRTGVHAAVDGRIEGCADVARLYEEQGERALELLRGSFALAIWDARERKLVLARDAFGTRTLYCANDHGRFLFASEPAAILAAMKERPHVDPISIDDVLAFGWTERRRTGYEEIERLLPGEIAVVRGGKLERRSGSNPPERPSASRGSLAVELERTVRASTHEGAPIGILLTGAAGSVALVEAASRVARGPLRTFAATFEGGDGAAARAAAGIQGAKHQEIPLEGKDLPRIAEEILAAQESPFADPELVRAHVACKAAREEVEACFSAEGSDEILGAGTRHRWMRSAGSRPRGPLALLPFFKTALAALPKLAFPGLRSALRVRIEEVEQRYVSRFVATEDRLRKRLFAKGRRAAFRQNESEREMWVDFGIAGELDERMRRHDLGHALPNRVLARSQRAATATGLEISFPFLDRDLVERVGPLALELGPSPTPSPDVPIDRWMRTELAPLVDGYLVGSRLAADGWLSEPAIAAVLRAHRAGRMDIGRTLYALLALEIWYRKRILGM